MRKKYSYWLILVLIFLLSSCAASNPEKRDMSARNKRIVGQNLHSSKVKKMNPHRSPVSKGYILKNKRKTQRWR